ncbi:MAG: ABC transporter ATP-binding protein [Candidatus Caldarchaeum sp.]|nr:ABC transporter ATP-binding protein [Candidatus Caldarchaeum sp.]
MSEILSLEHISKSFAGVKAVDDVSFQVRGGKIYGIIGPNGSGKTTLFNLISGLLKPDDGKIYFLGERIDGLPPHKIYERGLSRSFQIPTLFSKLRLAENMLVPPKNQKGESVRHASFQRIWAEQEKALAETAWEVMKTLRLSDLYDNQANSISGGQMKLLEIGRVMMSQPKLVLLDEPTAGILPALAEHIFKIIQEICKTQNLTFMIIEHRYDILFEYAEHIFLLNEGKLVAEGSPNALLKSQILEQVYLGG